MSLRVLSSQNPQVRLAVTVTGGPAPAPLLCGRIAEPLVRSSVTSPRDSLFFLCGPQPMVDDVRAMLLDMAVPPEQVRSEVFQAATAIGARQPGEAVEEPNGALARLLLTRSGRQIEIPQGATILDAAEAAGADIPSLCRSGVCGTCRTRLAAGDVQCTSDTLDEADREAGFILPCVGLGARRLLAGGLAVSINRAFRTAPRSRFEPAGALVHVLMLSGLSIAVLSFVMLVASGGWGYYTTPLDWRVHNQLHQTFKPSGRVGHSLGFAGLAMMTVPVLYSVRRRWKRAARFGSMKNWLELHIYCGIVGPGLVVFHTAGKFNGVISVAFWSMAMVVLSGFVGRYLVRPNSENHPRHRTHARRNSIAIGGDDGRSGRCRPARGSARANRRT